MLRVALVGNGDRIGFKLRVVRRILGALDAGTLGAICEHAAVPATAVRNVVVHLVTTTTAVRITVVVLYHGTAVSYNPLPILAREQARHTAEVLVCPLR